MVTNLVLKKERKESQRKNKTEITKACRSVFTKRVLLNLDATLPL